MLRLLQGLVAGYGGTALMDASQASVIPTVSSVVEKLSAQRQAENQESTSTGESQEEQLSSPEKVAKRTAELAGVQLSREELSTWGKRVHWLYGVQWGVTYLLLFQKPGPCSGLLYGALLWLGSDELLLWGLGIAKAPTSYPLKSHLQALAAHGVYGFAVGLLGKGLRA